MQPISIPGPIVAAVDRTRSGHLSLHYHRRRLTRQFPHPPLLLHDHHPELHRVETGTFRPGTGGFRPDVRSPSLVHPDRRAPAGGDQCECAIAVLNYKKKESLIGKTECPVCLSDFQDGDTLRQLPKCSHVFHMTCIDTWLSSHTNCPFCRASIVPDDSPEEVGVPIEDGSENQENGVGVHESDGGGGVSGLKRSFSIDSSVSLDTLGLKLGTGGSIEESLHTAPTVKMKRSVSYGGRPFYPSLKSLLPL